MPCCTPSAQCDMCTAFSSGLYNVIEENHGDTSRIRLVIWSDEIKDQVRTLRQSGKSIKDISMETGISKTSIWRFIKTM